MSETAEKIMCDSPGCPSAFIVQPGEGLAYAHMRAFDAGWTYTGSGVAFRDWCPGHPKPGAKPEGRA